MNEENSPADDTGKVPHPAHSSGLTVPARRTSRYVERPLKFVTTVWFAAIDS